MTYKNRIKELRLERNLSTRDLADIMNWSPMTINHYEKCRRDLSTESLVKLARFFEVTCDYLLGVSTCSLFILYEKSHLFIKINEDDYLKIKSLGYIYYNDNDDRCVDFNKMANVDESIELGFVIVESTRNIKIDSLFDNSKSNNKSISIEKLNTILGDIQVVNYELIDIKIIKDFFKES